MARFSALFAALAATVQGQFTIDDTTYSHEWIPRTAMGMPRSDMTATTVADAIYIIGGCSGDQTYTSAWGGMSLGGTSYHSYQVFSVFTFNSCCEMLFPHSSSGPFLSHNGARG